MSRRSLRISRFLVGLGVGNRDMNLYMVFSFHGGTRTHLSRPAPLIFMVVFVLVALSSDLSLQVPYQLRGGLAGKVFKTGNLEAGKHLSNVCLVIVCFSAERK